MVMFIFQEHPPKKRFSTRVATFAKGLSPSNSFRRKRYQDSKLPASRSFDNNENDKIEKITVKKSSEVQVRSWTENDSLLRGGGRY